MVSMVTSRFKLTNLKQSILPCLENQTSLFLLAVSRRRPGEGFEAAAINKRHALRSFGDRYCTGADLGGNSQGHLELFPGLLHSPVRGEGAGPNPVTMPFLADESRDLLALNPGQQSPGILIATEFACQKAWLLGGFRGGEVSIFLFRRRGRGNRRRSDWARAGGVGIGPLGP